MRAVQVLALDGPQSVAVVDIPEPDGDGQVVVDVHASGLNFPDVLQTRGLYQLKPDLPFVPGSEVAGLVRSAPHGSGFEAGDRVAAFSLLGGMAETAAVPPDRVFRLPDSVSFDVGAALPMNYLTMHFGLVRRARLRERDTVLVHGASGGIGTASIQLARALGARVIAVVSTPAKGEVARSAGADEVVPAEGFLPNIRELTDGRGVDIVVDPVGGHRFTDSLRSLATEGRRLVIGFAAGDIPTVKVNRLLLANTSVVGVGWGAFWMPRTGFLQQQWRDLLPLLESGRLKPPIGAVFPLERAAHALQAIEDRRATGKVLVMTR